MSRSGRQHDLLEAQLRVDEETESADAPVPRVDPGAEVDPLDGVAKIGATRRPLAGQVSPGAACSLTRSPSLRTYRSIP